MNDPASDSLGSTGDSPVPSGDSPDGMGKPSPLHSGADAHANATPTSVGGSPTEAGGSPAPPLPPPRIPDHELIKRIGRGAYGEVWIARSVTGAFRAVKIVRRSTFDHARPFEREFEGIQKFEPVSRTHESQVDILHVGRGEDYFYYVMELADDQATGGQINPDNYHPRTLKSDLLFHSRLSFEECVSIAIALTTALEHLHQSGLVHRDVKPSNIIFVNGVAKLADIGLVTGVDTTRSYVGTDGFAAPEGPGTAQGDLFSLGKVLYEMSTGKDRQEFPELPTNLRELPEREGLVELNAVIARACRHDPADRYAKAAAMRVDLELLQSGKSLARLHRLERQLRFVTRAGGVMTLVVTLVVAGWFYQRAQTREARRLSNHNRQLAAEKSRLADENRERLVRLSVANGMRLLEDRPTDGVLWLAKALSLVTNSPAESAIHRLRIQRAFDSLPVPIQVIPHEQYVTAATFNEDGRIFATGTLLGEFAVWDTDTGAERWSGKVNFPIRQMQFSRGGRNLLLASSFSETMSHTTYPGRSSGAAIIDLANGEPIFRKASQSRLTTGLSSDGRWIVLAQTNNIIQLMDAQDGRALLQMSGHTDIITAFAFNRDGSLLASASKDQTVHLWRLPSGKPVGIPLQNNISFERVVLSHNGQRLAAMGPPPSGGTKWSAQIWETATGARIGAPIPVNVLKECVLAFADAAGTRLFIGGDERPKYKTSYFLDIATGEEQAHLSTVPPRCWALSPDGQSIATGDDWGLVHIVSARTGELLLPPIRHTGWVESLCFSPDGTRLLATRESGTAILYKLKRPSAPVEKRFDASIPNWERNLFLGLMDVSQRRLLLPLMDGTIRLLDLEQLVELRTLNTTFSNNPPCVAASPDGRHWAAFSNPATVQGNKVAPDIVELWREDNGALNHFLLQHPMKVGYLRFDPASTQLVTHCADQRIRFWRTSDGRLDGTISLPDGNEQAVIFPDCRTALLMERGGRNGQLFDLTTKKLLGPPMPLGNLRFLSFAMESVRFAVAAQDFSTATANNHCRIWSARTGESLIPPCQQRGDIYSVDWSPDRRRIITAGLGGPNVWNATTGELLLPDLNNGSSGKVAAWSSDGRFIIAPGTSRDVRLMDGNTGEAVAPLFMCQGYVRFVTVVNNRLIALSDPNIIQAWDLKETQLPPDVILDYAQLLSGQRMNPGGFTIDLKARELADLLQSLRIRAPELFSTP